MKKYLLTISLAVASALLMPNEASAANALELIEIDQQQLNATISIVDNSLIRVVGGNGLTLQVYNITGVCIHEVKVDGYDRRYDFNLPKGCYIIKVGKTVRKVSVK